MSELIKHISYNLSLAPITLNDDYAKEWHIENTHDFLLLCNNGEPISNTLYRKGGLNGRLNVATDKYFMLIKYTEAEYTLDFMKMCYPKDKSKWHDRKHMANKWVIIDSKGIEKVVFEGINHGYIVDNSCIYSVKGSWYNIETGFLYGHSSSSLESDAFLFIDNKYDSIYNKNKDKLPKGVLKINKQTGEYEIFKNSK